MNNIKRFLKVIKTFFAKIHFFVLMTTFFIQTIQYGKEDFVGKPLEQFFGKEEAYRILANLTNGK